jgi:hypothetical protein
VKTDCHDVVVIGAGIAGLSCAGMLTTCRRSVVVLEKSRGVGGRAATRRIGGLPVDFGAQFFTVRTEVFAGQVRDWESVGLCRVWSHGFSRWENGVLLPATDGHPRYCCPPGITAIAKALAADCDVRRGHRVVSLVSGAGVWRIECEAGPTFEARAVVLAMPAPQAIALAGEVCSAKGRGSLASVEYAPCLSAVVEVPGFTPDWCGVQFAQGPLAWVAADDSRRTHTPSHRFVLHADSAFSTALYDAPPELALPPLLEHAAHSLHADFAAARLAHFHRWRYARVEQPLPSACLALNNNNTLLFAGDACGTPNLEAAFLSGRAAATAILERLSPHPANT